MKILQMQYITEVGVLAVEISELKYTKEVISLYFNKREKFLVPHFANDNPTVKDQIHLSEVLRRIKPAILSFIRMAKQLDEENAFGF